MQIEWTTSELKEMVLAWLAIVWSLILLFPGNVFLAPGSPNTLGILAEDWFWGALSITVAVALLALREVSYIRRLCHAYFWVFWLGIFFIALFRLSLTGITPTWLLLTSPFLAIALLHGIFYAGLGRRL